MELLFVIRNNGNMIGYINRNIGQNAIGWIGKEAIDFLIEQFSEEKEKPCVTTPVDYIVQMLDEKFEVLSSKFILQNINNKEGEITYYSNKLEQAELTRSLGFDSLSSEIIILNEFDENKKIDFPIILKPAACGEGSKDDIVICRNMSDMTTAIDVLRKKIIKNTVSKVLGKQNRNSCLWCGIKKI